MKNVYMSSLLYDFYGELLTDHQKDIYEDFMLNDLSLGEIAEERGVSRQSVHDLIKRCDKLLKGYEEKLHLIERFDKTRNDVLKICQLAELEADNSNMKKIKDIADDILDNY